MDVQSESVFIWRWSCSESQPCILLQPELRASALHLCAHLAAKDGAPRASRLGANLLPVSLDDLHRHRRRRAHRYFSAAAHFRGARHPQLQRSLRRAARSLGSDSFSRACEPRPLPKSHKWISPQHPHDYAPRVSPALPLPRLATLFARRTRWRRFSAPGCKKRRLVAAKHSFSSSPASAACSSSTIHSGSMN